MSRLGIMKICIKNILDWEMSFILASVTVIVIFLKVHTFYAFSKLVA